MSIELLLDYKFHLENHLEKENKNKKVSNTLINKHRKEALDEVNQILKNSVGLRNPKVDKTFLSRVRSLL